jgi:hypothetical protein
LGGLRCYGCGAVVAGLISPCGHVCERGKGVGCYATTVVVGQKPKGKRKEKKKKICINFQNQILIRVFTY